MSSKPIFGKRPVSLASRVPARLARRHSHRCHLRRSLPSPSTFLRSLRSRPVTALLRYYGRSASCPPGSPVLDQLQEHRLCNGQVSLIHAFSLPAIPSPPTCACSASPRHVTCWRVEPRLLPSGNSGLHLWLAGSPHPAGRIEFVILRTGRSPPAAPHPVSRRRSCSRLQVTLTWRGLPPLRLNALSGALAHGAKPWDLDAEEFFQPRRGDVRLKVKGDSSSVPHLHQHLDSRALQH
jgi:hypothetical protein